LINFHVIKKLPNVKLVDNYVYFIPR